MHGDFARKISPSEEALATYILKRGSPYIVQLAGEAKYEEKSNATEPGMLGNGPLCMYCTSVCVCILYIYMLFVCAWVRTLYTVFVCVYIITYVYLIGCSNSLTRFF